MKLLGLEAKRLHKTLKQVQLLAIESFLRCDARDMEAAVLGKNE